MTLTNGEYIIGDTNNSLPLSDDIDSEYESLKGIAAKCKEMGFGHKQPIIFWLLD